GEEKRSHRVDWPGTTVSSAPGIVDLANAYRQSGDGASAQAALQMAINLGQRLDDPGSLTILQSLVGIGLQRIVLNAMDPNSPYGDAGQTVQTRSKGEVNRFSALAASISSRRFLWQIAGNSLRNVVDAIQIVCVAAFARSGFGHGGLQRFLRPQNGAGAK